MDIQKLRGILQSVQDGNLNIDDALGSLQNLPYEDLGYANLDHHRALRQGFPEVVFAQGKTPQQVSEIMQRLRRQNPLVMASRADAATYNAVKQTLPEARYHEMARIITLGHEPTPPADHQGYVLVMSAGTSDLPVAEEAAVTTELLGSRVERLFDVGVAGIHRLLDHLPILNRADVIIVVAGMEGALSSVVGGLASCPVIAVPTSIGYGASFGGLAALLAMLNSCAAGIAVVNIDNGFGAGYLANRIVRLAQKLNPPPHATQSGDAVPGLRRAALEGATKSTP
jgi:pyridinium-3,5-biscarboxylic acid mononucleotide synthase